MSNWIFITGGCGYIGSHIAALLKTVTDYSIMLIDRRGAEFPHITRYCDLFADEDFSSDVVMQAIRDYKPEFIIHCADDASIENGIQDPLSVWDYNATKTIKLLKCCATHGVKKFIFYSTSQIYAASDHPKIETDAISLASTYSRTKFSIEQILKDCYISHGISSASIRLFTVAGNHPLYDLGPLYGSPQLVSKIMESVVHDSRLEIYGKDYPTPDGTAIRDYLHVMDLAEANLKLIAWLSENSGAHIFNISSGQGTSVQEMVSAAESLFAKNIPFTYEPRKLSELPINLGDATKALTELNWKPTRTIHEIFLDSFKWYNSSLYQSFKKLGLRHYVNNY